MGIAQKRFAAGRERGERDPGDRLERAVVVVRYSQGLDVLLLALQPLATERCVLLFDQARPRRIEREPLLAILGVRNFDWSRLVLNDAPIG